MASLVLYRRQGIYAHLNCDSQYGGMLEGSYALEYNPIVITLLAYALSALRSQRSSLPSQKLHSTKLVLKIFTNNHTGSNSVFPPLQGACRHRKSNAPWTIGAIVDARCRRDIGYYRTPSPLWDVLWISPSSSQC